MIILDDVKLFNLLITNIKRSNSSMLLAWRGDDCYACLVYANAFTFLTRPSRHSSCIIFKHTHTHMHKHIYTYINISRHKRIYKNTNKLYMCLCTLFYIISFFIYLFISFFLSTDLYYFNFFFFYFLFHFSLFSFAARHPTYSYACRVSISICSLFLYTSMHTSWIIHK